MDVMAVVLVGTDQQVVRIAVVVLACHTARTAVVVSTGILLRNKTAAVRRSRQARRFRCRSFHFLGRRVGRRIECWDTWMEQGVA